MKKKVLLTGVSGFLGSHTAIKLLNKGYQVTVRLNSVDIFLSARFICVIFLKGEKVYKPLF